MLIKVVHRSLWGRDLFYAGDTWAQRFFHFLRPTRPLKCLSSEQVQQLKNLGFTFEIQSAPPPELK